MKHTTVHKILHKYFAGTIVLNRKICKEKVNGIQRKLIRLDEYTYYQITPSDGPTYKSFIDEGGSITQINKGDVLVGFVYQNETTCEFREAKS
jgi:hypothetical protein